MTSRRALPDPPGVFWFVFPANGAVPIGRVEPSRGIDGGYDAFALGERVLDVGEHLGVFVSRELAGDFLGAWHAAPAITELGHVSEFAGSGP